MASSLPCAKLLLEADANLGHVNAQGSTVLHFACYSDTENLALFKFLAEKDGADPSLIDVDNRSALMIACMKGHAKIAVYCAETLKLDGWALDVGKKSPISMATARGYLPLAEKLTALCGPEPERAPAAGRAGGVMHMMQQRAAMKAVYGAAAPAAAAPAPQNMSAAMTSGRGGEKTEAEMKKEAEVETAVQGMHLAAQNRRKVEMVQEEIDAEKKAVKAKVDAARPMAPRSNFAAGVHATKSASLR
jgi:ankyrin repeat protein